MRPDWKYTFDEIAELTHLLHSYLRWRDTAPKTPLAALGIELARAILGTTLTRDFNWMPGYSRDITERRIKSAGLDPKCPMKIIDGRRAAWCWYQLRTTKRYSEKRQEILMSSGEEPPDLNTPLVFPNSRIKKRVLEQQQKTNARQDFSRKLREHFE